MKSYKLKWLLGLISVFIAISLGSCEDDETKGSWETQSLEALITEAENLMENAEEGINAGDYKLGSKDQLQEVVDWVYWRIDNSDSQDDIADAAIKLQKYIDIFKASTVAVAMPWIKQENDTYIQISDNIKSVLDGAWTIELKCYIVDLNSKGYSNNLFSAEQSDPDSGFGVRYFSDGSIQVVTGNSNWVDSGDQAGAGTMKSGEWMDVTMTSDGTHHELFINGAKVAAIDNTHLLAADASFVIGNSPTWTDRVCNAVVKDFKVWDSVLDAATIDANRTQSFEGTESGLICYFPFGSDLGTEFSDVTGNYTATTVGEIEWVAEPPVVVLDYDNLNAAIVKMETLKANVTEGENDGDYPVGTLDYIDNIIAEGNDMLDNETRQSALDDFATTIDEQIAIINSMLVGDADGIYVDREDSDAVGFRITPNYTPQGSYTVEFDVKLKTLFFESGSDGEIFGNGTYGLRVYGYNEYTEEAILNAGRIWNFTETSGGWSGPESPALALKPGNWQHVAIVHDQDALTTSIYVDGVMVVSQSDINYPNESGWGEIWLGNSWGGKMNGSIKEFRIWDEALDANDLNAQIAGSEANLRMYFPLTKVKGVQFADETGNFTGDMRGIEWNK